MIRVLAFVEGPTEEKFIKETIAPAFLQQEVFMSPTTHGGVRRWPHVSKELLRYLKEDARRYVTTMFDYYGMPSDWPGRDAARRQAHSEKAATVERAILDDISEAMGNAFDRRRFIPYVQMHEFEALLFSDPDILGKVIPEQDITEDLIGIANSFSTPEEINDNQKTAPSKRILRLSPKYQKVLHGSIAAQQIGLPRMRQKCPHFGRWLTKLEQLRQGNDT